MGKRKDKKNEILTIDVKKKPKNKDLQKLKAVGFDLFDQAAWAMACYQCHTDNEIMRGVLNIISENPIPEDAEIIIDADKFDEAIKSFFAKYGLQLT